MLGQHPELYSFPELRLFNGDTLGAVLRYYQTLLASDEATLRSCGEVLAGRQIVFFKLREQCREGPRFSDGLLRAVAELLFAGQTSKEVEQANTWLHARQDWSIREVFDVLLAAIEPRIGIDKTPHTASSRAAMDRIRRFYPGARFLHLTRHPVTTVQSMQEYKWEWFRRAHPDGDPRRLFGYFAQVWDDTHRGILAFTSMLPLGHVMRVRGEDLLNQPELHLTRIVQWLRVRADPEAIEAMRHPERWPYAKPGPETARLGNDPKFLAQPQLRAPSRQPPLKPPSQWGLDTGLWRSIEGLAHELGYSESDFNAHDEEDADR
jgi:hypothetical protein